MGLFDKVKNLFTEEVEVEEEVKPVKKPEIKKEEIKKEMIQVEIPSPVKETRSEKHEKEIIETEIKEVKKEEKKFPFFDDNDFNTLDEIKVPKKEEKKTSYRNEVYNPPKEEKKVFKPSPIISPVYGIMDKNYQEEKMRKEESTYNAKEASIDEIRNRAYGSLESDIETTLFGKKRVLFEEENQTNEEVNDEQFGSNTIGEKPRHAGTKESDDLADLISAEMEEDTPKTNEDSKKTPRKISDSELFSLIDSMYEKGDKKQWVFLCKRYLLYFTSY